MMGDQVEGFVEGLIEKTREGKLDWKPFSSFKNRRDILEELENGRGDFDYATNSIKESKSYFLQSGEGFVFLFEIYHGDPQVASPLDNTIGLMVKINSVLPLNSLLGYTEMMQEGDGAYGTGSGLCVLFSRRKPGKSAEILQKNL